MDKEELQRLTELSRIGDALTDFKSTGLPVLKKYVLDPMYQAAFEAFKKVDPSDSLQVIQTQQIGKVIDQIEAEIDSRIQEGKLAQEYLKNSTQEGE